MKLLLTALLWLVAVSVVCGDQAERDDGRPFVAVWRQYDGSRAASEAPYLRFAIWADGRALFADDPSKWSHELRRGKISETRVARLKAALSDTGIFELKRTSYLVPSAPKDCLMVDLDGKRQLLYWDERESPGYGININPEPHDLEFMRCWKAVNHLGVVALPDEGEVVKERVHIPKSWHLTQPDTASAHTKAMDHSDYPTNDHRPHPPQPTETDRGRAWWKQMEEWDAKLLRQFEQITVGMSPTQVRGVMGMDAQMKRENLWGFKLSRASDTPNEVDWVLLVAFENGKVTSKQTTYTCLYTTVRE